MCTVTVLPGAEQPASVEGEDGALLVRVVCNRDERRTRAPALAPRVWDANGRQVLSPLDPQGGGTWIAVSDAGLVFVLLNATTARRVPDPRWISRGLVIPGLADSRSLAEVARRARELPCNAFDGFHLVAVGGGQLLDVWRSPARSGQRLQRLRHPVLRTSSSLGDRLVEGPRRRLFARMLGGGASAAAQDRYHRHAWPSRGAVSVVMDRAEAATVSRTTVEVHERSARLVYESLLPSGGDRQLFRLTLCHPAS